jgi:hypothetical protein
MAATLGAFVLAGAGRRTRTSIKGWFPSAGVNRWRAPELARRRRGVQPPQFLDSAFALFRKRTFPSYFSNNTRTMDRQRGDRNVAVDNGLVNAITTLNSHAHGIRCAHTLEDTWAGGQLALVSGHPKSFVFLRMTTATGTRGADYNLSTFEPEAGACIRLSSTNGNEAYVVGDVTSFSRRRARAPDWRRLPR